MRPREGSVRPAELEARRAEPVLELHLPLPLRSPGAVIRAGGSQIPAATRPCSWQRAADSDRDTFPGSARQRHSFPPVLLLRSCFALASSISASKAASTSAESFQRWPVRARRHGTVAAIPYRRRSGGAGGRVPKIAFTDQPENCTRVVMSRFMSRGAAAIPRKLAEIRESRLQQARHKISDRPKAPGRLVH